MFKTNELFVFRTFGNVIALALCVFAITPFTSLSQYRSNIISDGCLGDVDVHCFVSFIQLTPPRNSCHEMNFRMLGNRYVTRS